MPTAAPADVEICLPVGEKKRKDVSAAANDEGTPPKKKYKKRYCKVEGCDNWRIEGGVCMKHGAKVKLCKDEGCTNIVVEGGVCMRHGAKVKLCSSEGCTNNAQKGGVCKRHGAKVKIKRCSSEGCTNYAKTGGVCMRHGAKVKRCSIDGCKNHVQGRGLCKRHGAKGKPLCSSEGCTKQVQNGGVCRRHGATKKLCSFEGCSNQVVSKGVCKRHEAISVVAASRSSGKIIEQSGLHKPRRKLQVTRQRSSRQQGGGNQNKVSKGVKISDNEEEMEQKLSPIVGRKWKTKVQDRYADEPRRRSGRLRQGAIRSPQANVQGGDDQSESTVKVMDTSDEEGEWELKDQVSTSKVAARRSARFFKGEKVNYNVDDAFDAQLGFIDTKEGDEAEAANQKHDESDATPPKGARMRGERNLNDNREEDESDVISTQEGEGGLSKKDDGDGESWGSDGQHDVDLGGEGGVYSEEVNLPQMGSGFDGIDDEEKKNTTNPSSQDKEQAQMDKGKSGAHNSTEKDAILTQTKTNDGLLDVLSKQHRGQESNKGSKTLRNSSSDEDDVVSGVEQNDTLRQHTIELETEKHDSWDEANQEDYHEETDKQGTHAIKLCAELKKTKTKKAIIESQLQLKTTEWQVMTSSASDTENECDYGKEDGRDVQAAKDADDAQLEEMTKNFEAEKAGPNSQVQASSKELNELKNQVEINAAQNEAVMQKMIDDFAAERSGLESKLNLQQSKIEGLRDELKGQKVELEEKDEEITDMRRKEQISIDKLREASTSLEEANSRNVLLTKQLEDMKHQLRHKEDALAKEEAERKRLHSSIDAAKQKYAADFEFVNSQLKTNSDAMKTLNSHLTEVKAGKAEAESQLNLKIAELQEMTAKASDAEERVESVEDKLTQARISLEANNDEVTQLNAQLEDMEGRHQAALKREETLVKQLERLQFQRGSRKKSTPNTKSCLEGNNTGEPVRKTIEANLRTEIEALMNTDNIPNVSLDDIIGQKTAKDALLYLKPFRDPKHECFYADNEDDSNSNTGILLYGPPGTVS